MKKGTGKAGATLATGSGVGAGVIAGAAAARMAAGDEASMDFLLPGGRSTMDRDPTASEFSHRLLAANGDIGALRTAAVLRENEWREYDTAVQQIARGEFSLVRDMMAEGLRTAMPNAMARTQLVWDRAGDMDDAQIDMSGEAQDIRDRMEFAQDSMPIPIIHKGFRLNIRHLLASRQNGAGLDLQHAELATMKVVHTIEKLFLYGNFNAGTNIGRVYGMTTYPYRATGSLTASWTTATAAQIFADVNAMVAALEAKNQFGPYGLYVPTNYAAALRKDYDRTTYAGASVMKRLMEIQNLKYIRTNVFMPADQVFMLNLSKQTAEVLDGIQPRMIEWSVQGGMVFLFKVMAIILPRIKRDALDQTGIAHYSV